MSRDKPVSDPAPLGSLLPGAASRLGVDDAGAVGAVWGRWLDIVGPDVAAHAEPTSLRSGVLRIRADSPVWAHEIGYLAEEIKGRTNALLGRAAVAEVRIWSGLSKTAGTGSPDRSRATSGEPPASTGHEESADPQSALERARRAWLSRRGSAR